MTDRQAALIALLELADPPGLRRAHRLTCSGDPRRHERVLLPLLVRWKVRREIEREPEMSAARCVYPLQVRRTA